MSNASVKYEISDQIATITINNPPANALSSVMMEDLAKSIEELSKEVDAKVLIVTGAGNMFVAGADIQEIAQFSSAEQASKLAGRGQEILERMEGMGKPVFAAINGLFCLGGGLELAMACHIRIAGERVRLGQPEIDLGIIPGFGGTQRLPRLVGSGKALELILSGKRITSQEAKAIGLVDQVVPDAEVLKQARGLARTIAAKGQVAVRAALRAVREGLLLPVREGLDLENKLFGSLAETEDMKEGVKAFIEKRQPQFKDR